MARTLEEQANSLASYLPTGRVWGSKNISGTVMRALLEGLSGELIRNAALIEEFRQEILPDETILMLDEWERAVGIPDKCFTGRGTDDERRNDVLAKLASLGVQTAEDMRLLALRVYGIALTITTPTRNPEHVFPYTFNLVAGTPDPDTDAGVMRFDLSDREARFQIIINYDDLPEPVVFPYTFPIPFLTRELAVIQCLFTLLRPANVGFTKQVLVPTDSVVPPPEAPFVPLSEFSLEFDRAVAFSMLETLTDDTGFDFKFPNASGQFSLALWAKSTGTSISIGTLMHFGEIGAPLSGNRFLITNNSSNGSLAIDIESQSPFRIKRYNTAVASTPTSASPDWFHVVVTYDGLNDAESLKIYIDGVVEATTKTTDQDISAIINRDMYGAIGSFKLQAGTGTQPAKHFIFMEAAWDKELSQAEITAMFALGDGNFDLRINDISGGYQGAANLQSYILVGREADPNLGRNLGLSGIDISVASEIDPVDPDLKRSSDIPAP